MQLLSIRLCNVRRFTAPVEISGIGPGLNVLTAPNEYGKSTFFDALHAAFFVSHRSFAGEVKRLAPHVGGDPQVAVAFRMGGTEWRLEKQWSTAQGRKQARLWRDGTLAAQAGQAEDMLATLLAPPADGGPAGLLWVRQGLTGLAEKGDELTTRRTLLTSVAGEVDAMTGGRQMEALRQQIDAELGQVLTRTGKPLKSGALHAAEQEVATLRAERDRLRAASAELRDALAQRRSKRAEKRALEDPEDAARRAGQLEAARAALRDAERHEAARRSAEEAERMAQIELQATENDRTRLSEALDEHRLAREAHDTAQAAWSAASAEAAHCADALAQSAALRTEAEVAEREARALSRQVRDAERAVQAVARRTELTRRLAVADAAWQARETAKAASRAGPTEATLRTLRSLQTALEAARIARDSAAPSVTLHYSGAARVRQGSAPLPADTKLPFPEGATLDLDGIGRLTLHPGKAAAGAGGAGVGGAEAALEAALHKAGHATLEAAETAATRRTEAERAHAEATATLQAAAPEGIDALRDAIAQLPAEVAQDAALPSLTEATKAEDAAGETLLEANAIYELARNAADAAQKTLAGAEADLRAATTRTQRATQALSRHEDPRAALAALTARRDAQAEARSRAVRARMALEADAPDMTTLAARHDRAAAAIESVRTALHRLDVDLRGLDAQIATRAGEAIEEESADIAERLADAERRHAAIAEECTILQRLAEALDTARAAARDHYLAPVVCELVPLVRMLWPEAQLSLDPDNLMPDSLVRHDTPEDIELLSGGTREQIALLVRLAFARMLASKGRPAPVILDDAIVYADDERIVTLFDTLTLQASDLQVIVFSCRQRAFRDLGGTTLTIAPAAPAEASPATSP